MACVLSTPVSHERGALVESTPLRAQLVLEPCGSSQGHTQGARGSVARGHSAGGGCMRLASARTSALERGALVESTPQHARRVREARGYPQGPTRGSERLRSEWPRCGKGAHEARVSSHECVSSKECSQKALLSTPGVCARYAATRRDPLAGAIGSIASGRGASRRPTRLASTRASTKTQLERRGFAPSTRR